MQDNLVLLARGEVGLTTFFLATGFLTVLGTCPVARFFAVAVTLFFVITLRLAIPFAADLSRVGIMALFGIIRLGIRGAAAETLDGAAWEAADVADLRFAAGLRAGVAVGGRKSPRNSS